MKLAGMAVLLIIVIGDHAVIRVSERRVERSRPDELLAVADHYRSSRPRPPGAAGRIRIVTSKRIRSAGVLALVVLVALVWLDARVITGGQNTKDGAQYERLAVELARSGSFASGGALTREVEPLHVALLALQVRLDPRLADVRASGRVAAGAQSRAVKQQNLLWAGLTLAGVAAQILLLRRDRGRVVLAGAAMVAVTVLLLENTDVVDRSLAELPAAGLVVWSGVLATRLVRAPSIGRGAALGVAIAGLALTRAVFLWVALPYALLIAGGIWLAVLPTLGPAAAARRAGMLLLAGSLAFGVVVGPWAVRNAVAFGDPGIAERGGSILHMRATKNTMDGYQHRGAWVYWAPLPLQPPLARVLDVDLADFGSGRPLVVHARDDDEVRDESFYRTAKQEIDDRADRLVLEGVERREADRIAEEEYGSLAAALLQSDPWAFLRTTPVFLWRFSWPMNLSLSVPRPLLGVVNLAGMAALLSAAVLAVVRRWTVLFAVVGLPAGATAFYALVTHALPRYARPLAPTMVILLVVLAAALYDRAARPRPRGGT